jgi:hypothetical protein
MSRPDAERPGGHPGDRPRPGNGLGTWLLADPQSGGSESRLRLDSTVQEFFDDYVIQAASDEERAAVIAAAGASSSDEDGEDVRIALAAAVDHLARRLARRLTGHLDERHPGREPAAVLSRIGKLHETLKTRFEAVVIEVLRPGMSPQLFSGLNARGPPLDEADKVKKELSIVSPESDHVQVKERWDAMVRAIPGRGAQAFLRLRHVAFVGDTREADLYVNVRRLELTGGSGCRRPCGAARRL